MTDEQRIALAHWRRVSMRIEDMPVTERTARCLSALALLSEDLMAGSLAGMQERARVVLALMDPANDD